MFCDVMLYDPMLPYHIKEYAVSRCSSFCYMTLYNITVHHNCGEICLPYRVILYGALLVCLMSYDITLYYVIFYCTTV